MSIRPYIRQSAVAPRYFLPGDIDTNGISHTGGLDTLQVKIPQRRGEKFFDGATSLQAEQITVSGKLRSADYDTAASFFAEYNTFRTGIRAYETSDYAVEFGWYDSDADTAVYTSEAYITQWSMDKSSHLPHKPWNDTPWSVTITVPDPNTWSDVVSGGSGSPAADNIYLEAGTIRLIAGTLVEIRDTDNNLICTIDTASGDVKITGDYGFL